MLFNLIYISQATHFFNAQQLLALLEQSRENNLDKGITGMLIYLEDKRINIAGRFMQVLEGDRKEIEYLYEKIQADTRHHHVTVVHEGIISKRTFKDWLMCFKSASADTYEEMPGYRDIDQSFSRNGKTVKFDVANNFLKSFYALR